MPEQLAATGRLLTTVAEGQFLATFCGLPAAGRRRLIVEFSSPNIAKPFHAGHLRSTLLGRFVGNLFRSAGDHVLCINYLGDWGTQFGMIQQGLGLLGVQEEDLTDLKLSTLAEAYARAHGDGRPDGVLVAARNFFANLEKGKPEAMNLWQQVCSAGMDHLENLYADIGVRFDCTQRESQFAKGARSLVDRWLSSGFLTYDNGAVGVKRDGRIIALRKSDGSTLYLSRDVAAALSRNRTYSPQEMYYVVDNGQTMHFENLKAVLSACGHQEVAKKVKHIKFGKIRNMSSRRGTGVLLQDLMEEGERRAEILLRTASTTKITAEEYGRVAKQLALSALCIRDFKQRRCLDYDFSWEKALQVDGATGYQLHATYSRLCSLCSRFEHLLKVDAGDLNRLTQPQAMSLIDHLAVHRLKEVLYKAYDEVEPCPIVQYLFRLCKLCNSAHKHLRVCDVDAQDAKPRLFLFSTARLVIYHCLRLLGIEPLDKI